MNICLTFDSDWASEQVLEYTLLILQEYGVKSTIFATNESRVLNSVSPVDTEIALHPKFEKINSKPIENLLEIFPEAVGYRSHSLVDVPSIRETAHSLGLQYESNLYLPKIFSPFKDFSGLIRIPFCWSDFVSITANQGFDFDWKINLNGTCCIAFHPIHIFLNSENMERYKASFGVKDAFELASLQNKSKTPGAKDSLVKFLEKFASSSEFVFAKEITSDKAGESISFPECL